MLQSKSRAAIFSVAIAFASSSCSNIFSGMRDYQEAVAHDFSDPSSAQFRDEKVRVIWSKNGERLKIYCAEVNSKNSFGGMTGFRPVIYVIDTKYNKIAGKNVTWVKGLVEISETGLSSNYYLFCQRPDTERPEKYLNSYWLDAGEPLSIEQKAYIDHEVPILSNDTVTE